MGIRAENVLQKCAEAFVIAQKSQHDCGRDGSDQNAAENLADQDQDRFALALKQGREVGVFPAIRENLWAYEEAYPCKVFWWLLNKMGGSR